MEEEKRRPPKRSSKSGSSGSAPEEERPAREGRKRTSKPESTVNMVQVQIAVDDQHLKDFAKIVECGRELGLEVDQELPEVGVISGRMPADKVADMEDVEGVYAVERPRSYRIPPPESNVQ